MAAQFLSFLPMLAQGAGNESPGQGANSYSPTRKQVSRAMRSLGTDLMALATGSGVPPLEPPLDPMEGLNVEQAREQLRANRAANESAEMGRERILGLYNPTTGGVPWNYPGAEPGYDQGFLGGAPPNGGGGGGFLAAPIAAQGGQAPFTTREANPEVARAQPQSRRLTGGFLDQVPLNETQRAVIEAEVLGAYVPEGLYQMAFPEAAEPPQPKVVGDRLVSSTGRVLYEPPAEDQPPLAGTGMPQQTMNRLLRAQGDRDYRSTPEYMAFYNSAAQPKYRQDPVTQQWMQYQPDMSAYPEPTFPGFGGGSPSGRAGQPVTAGPSPATSERLGEASPEAAFGGQSVWQNFGNFLWDLVGQPLPFPETQEAIDVVKDMNSEAVTLMATGRGGRPSNITIEEIRNLNPTPGSIWVGDQRAASKMLRMRNRVKEHYGLAVRYSTDPSISAKDQAVNRVDAPRLKQMLDWYDGALARFSAQGQGAFDADIGMQPGEIRQHPGGGTYELIVE